MTKYKDTLKYLIPLWIVTVVALIITFAYHGNLIIDCGREAYYPQEILAGKILYKDLFNIYGPFAYLFNAILYKIFGINLTTLYVAGSICAFGIITTLFFIAKRFLNSNLAFYIGIFSIVIGILPVYIFNYVFPYAFAMTYGLLACLLAILFLIYYIDSHADKFYLISLFFAGFAIANKYEFLPILLVFLLVTIKLKPKFNTIFLGILSFLLIPEMSFAYLFAQGLSFSDLLNTVNIINVMAHTQTLMYFYIHSGIFFHKKTPFEIFITFTMFSIPFLFYLVPVIFKNKINNQIIKLFFTYGGICLLFLTLDPKLNDYFAFLPFLLFVLSLIFIKKLINNFALFTLCSCTILISLKVFWSLILASYGIYFAPLIVISILAIFKDKFLDKELDYIGFFILITSLLFAFNYFQQISLKHFSITTQKGTIFNKEQYHKTTAQLMDFISKNTKKTDKILILPEGMMINFLSDRKTDDFYNTLLPLYEETFSDEVVISHFKKSMPDYVIFNNWNSNEYYFSIICEDYAFDFCQFVKNNYFEKTRLIGNFNYIIFQKK